MKNSSIFVIHTYFIFRNCIQIIKQYFWYPQMCPFPWMVLKCRSRTFATSKHLDTECSLGEFTIISHHNIKPVPGTWFIWFVHFNRLLHHTLWICSHLLHQFLMPDQPLHFTLHSETHSAVITSYYRMFFGVQRSRHFIINRCFVYIYILAECRHTEQPTNARDATLRTTC